MRRHVTHRVAGLLAIGPAELEIAKAGRIPFVRCRSARLPIDLSLSHHGRYAPWACELPPAEGSA